MCATWRLSERSRPLVVDCLATGKSSHGRSLRRDLVCYYFRVESLHGTRRPPEPVQSPPGAGGDGRPRTASSRSTRIRRRCGSISILAGTGPWPRSGPARRWPDGSSGSVAPPGPLPSRSPPTTWRSATPSTARWTGTSRRHGFRPCSTTSTQLNIDRLGDRRGDNTSLLRFRRHRCGPELPGRQRVPRMDGRQVPGASARRAEPGRPPRAHARRRGGAATGGSRHRRRQPAARRLLRAPRAREAGREPARPTEHRPDRDRPHPVPRHRVPQRRQPAGGAASWSSSG